MLEHGQSRAQIKSILSRQNFIDFTSAGACLCIDSTDMHSRFGFLLFLTLLELCSLLHELFLWICSSILFSVVQPQFPSTQPTALQFQSKLLFGCCSSFRLKMCKKASHVIGKLAIKMYKGFLGYMFSNLINAVFGYNLKWSLSSHYFSFVHKRNGERKRKSPLFFSLFQFSIVNIC